MTFWLKTNQVRGISKAESVKYTRRGSVKKLQIGHKAKVNLKRDRHQEKRGIYSLFYMPFNRNKRK